MEFRNTKTATYTNGFNSLESFDGDDELTRQRLDALLAINAETARAKSLYASDREKVEADLMKNPLSVEQAYAYFGVLLGAFPPAALFTRFIIDSGNLRGEDSWVFGIFAIVSLVSAIVGYFSGKAIGRIVRKVEQASWAKMLLLLPFIGILWGILAGGAGGAVIFVFGAIVGAFLGAIVGSVALPVFTIFHRLLKKGDQIDRKHFLPVAFGITFSICAFVLGA
jgi:MFS family permease